MSNTVRLLTIATLSLLLFTCEKEALEPQITSIDISTAKAPPLAKQQPQGATQIDGIGFFAEESDCDLAAEGADYALLLTGDLEGCLYVFVEDFDCSPSGTYRESGQEYFVGTYNGSSGTFWTDYKFSSKYEGCSEEGFFLGAEIFGRCQHPIVRGSGTGVFEGVNGRLDFKDDVAAGNFPYRGHLRY